MSPFNVGLISLILLFILLFSGMPIGFVMALIGFLGTCYLVSVNAGFTILGSIFYSTAASYMLSVIPLFVLMGQFAAHSGISKDLYNAANKLFGHFRGGLAIATIGACCGFAAICGSSFAAAATMGTVALPEMRRHNYDPGLAAGTIAAGGTLGILIPPSTAFAFFALITELSIGKLFIAGILPGLLLALLFVLAIYFSALINPKVAPLVPRATSKEMVLALKGIWGVVILFIVVIGGLYLGVFTPTEAAGVGGFGSLIIIIIRRKLTFQNFMDTIRSTASVTAMIFLMLTGSFIYSYFFSITRIPSILADSFVTLQLSKYIILALLVLLYAILGCFMDGFSMIILTIPVIFPCILNLGFDPIWFGVIIVILLEMGMITPPVGVNVFIIQGIAKDIPMYTIFRGIVPFFIAMIVCIVLLTVFPQIALFLPDTMKGG